MNEQQHAESAGEVTNIVRQPDPAVTAQPSGKEPWWTDARKSALSTLIALLVTPLSVVVTLVVTESYKAARPSIEYVNGSAGFFAPEPSPAVAEQVRKNNFVSTVLRQQVRVAATSSGKDPIECARWLDGGDWDADWLPIYRQVTKESEAQLHVALTMNLKSQKLREIGLPVVDKKDQEEALKIIEAFRSELDSFDSRPRPRAGDAEITVGILNKGSEDGTIFRDATIWFEGNRMPVQAPAFKVVKAHSFEEITFRTGFEQDGKVRNKASKAVDSVVKKWSDKVKNGGVSFRIDVMVSDKTRSKEGSVPAPNE